MATYNNRDFLHYSVSPAYSDLHNPGDPTPFSGIYRCTGCGYEVASVQSHPLPPQNHHQHSVVAPIQWQLIVFAQHIEPEKKEPLFRVRQ